MLHKDRLTTVGLDESLESALSKIEEGNFLSLPVVDDSECKGLIMKEAIYRKFFEDGYADKMEYLKKTDVRDIYFDKFEAISGSDRIEKASYLLKESRIPFLTVQDLDGKFEGILTHKAIFNAFSEIIGIDKGCRIVINLVDIPGQLARLNDFLRKERTNIMNLAILDAKVMGIVRVILRVDTEAADELIERIKAEGFKVAE